METTKLSSKGQVIIPKAFRASHNWDTGQELVVIDMGDGILLRPKGPFEETSLDQVAGSLKHSGKAKTQEDINSAMEKAARSAWRDRS